MHIIDHLESEVNWHKVFGVVDSLYGDFGFTSNADNFTRATTVEKAFDRFSNLVRVDQNGYDFIYDSGDEILKVELKMGKNLFQKRNQYTTKKFKVKNFQGDKKTVEDYKNEKTFDYMLVIDLTSRRVVVVEDDRARFLYESGGDGVMISLNIGDYYECDIGLVQPIAPKKVLSEELDIAIENYLNF